MTTLRDVWVQQGLTSTQVAGLAKVSVPTLYAMNRKEGNVSFATVQAVCQILGLTLAEYAALDACPKSDRYK
jgi:DNA-binding phage protein